MNKTRGNHRDIFRYLTLFKKHFRCLDEKAFYSKKSSFSKWKKKELLRNITLLDDALYNKFPRFSWYIYVGRKSVLKKKTLSFYPRSTANLEKNPKSKSQKCTVLMKELMGSCDWQVNVKKSTVWVNDLFHIINLGGKQKHASPRLNYRRIERLTLHSKCFAFCYFS